MKYNKIITVWDIDKNNEYKSVPYNANIGIMSEASIRLVLNTVVYLFGVISNIKITLSTQVFYYV